MASTINAETIGLITTRDTTITTITNANQVVELTNASFVNGPLVIHQDFYILNDAVVNGSTQNTIFRFVEDVVFNPDKFEILENCMNTGRVASTSTYINEERLDANTRIAFKELDFWAGIVCVGASNVMIDFNGHSFGQADEHALQQRTHFSLISLSNVPYRGANGYGTHELGEPIGSSNIVITSIAQPSKPILTRSSQHGISGINCENIFIGVSEVNDTNNTSLYFGIEKYEETAIHLQSCESVYIDNVYIGKNYGVEMADTILVHERYAQARILHKVLTGLIETDVSLQQLSGLDTNLQEMKTELELNCQIWFNLKIRNEMSINQYPHALFENSTTNRSANLCGIRISESGDYTDFSTTIPQSYRSKYIRFGKNIQFDTITVNRVETICAYHQENAEDAYDVAKTSTILRDMIGGIFDIFPTETYNFNNLGWKLTGAGMFPKYIIDNNNPIITTQILLNKHKSGINGKYGFQVFKSNIPDGFDDENGTRIEFDNINQIVMPILNCTARGEFIKPVCGIHLEQTESIYFEATGMNDRMLFTSILNSSTESYIINAYGSITTNKDDNTTGLTMDMTLFDTNYLGTYYNKTNSIRAGQTYNTNSIADVVGILYSCVKNSVLQKIDEITCTAYVGLAYGCYLIGNNDSCYFTSNDVRMNITANSTSKDETDYYDYPITYANAGSYVITGNFSNISFPNSIPEGNLNIISNNFNVFTVGKGTVGLENLKVSFIYDNEREARTVIVGLKQPTDTITVNELINSVSQMYVTDIILIERNGIPFHPLLTAPMIAVLMGRPLKLSEIQQSNQAVYSSLTNIGESASIDIDLGRLPFGSLTVTNLDGSNYRVDYPDGRTEIMTIGTQGRYGDFVFVIGSFQGQYDIENIQEEKRVVYVRDIKPYSATNNSARARGFFMARRLLKNNAGLKEYVNKTKKPASAGERILFLQLRNQRK